MQYGHVHAKSVSDLVELRFKFQEIKDRKEAEDKDAGKTGPAATNFSSVTFKLET